MKKAYIVIAVIIIFIGSGTWYIITRNNSKNTHVSTTAAVATSQVAIRDFSFSPSIITVKAGTKVTWTNKGSVAHTVTETNNLHGPMSDDIEPGISYHFTFTKVGTYHYRCSIHTDMTGTVIVTN